MIQRGLQERILDDLSFFPVVAIVGPRQVGKTTLARVIQKNMNVNCLYLDLELNTDAEKLQNAESFLRSHADKCVIIDEIQQKPTLFNLLRALIDEDRRPARFIVLGSASPSLIRQSADSLAGRVSYVELTPFSLLEINTIYTQQQHWFKGGFPSSLLASDKFAQRWVDNFLTTFVERDLRQLGYQISANTLQKMLTLLASINGNLLNNNDLARSLGITGPTVSHYIDLLEGGFMVHRLPPYFANVSKRLVKSPKVYVRDSGILHRLLRLSSFDGLLGHAIVGASWEGYVIEEICRIAEPTTEFYFYRTQAGAEVDLLIILPNSKKLCVEIKFADVPVLSKGYYQSILDLSPDYQYVIIPQSELYLKNESIKVCGLLPFLTQEWPQLMG